MKKVLIILSLFLITFAGYGQLKAPYGIWITAPWKIDGTTVTSTAAQINLLTGALMTPAELNHLVGVTSPIQTQINATVKITGNQTVAGDKTFTGTLLAPTAVVGTSTTQIATTAFTATGLALKVNLADSVSGPSNYSSANRVKIIEDDLADYETIPSVTVLFGYGSGNAGDTLSLSSTGVYGNWYQGSTKTFRVDTLVVSMIHGEGLDTLGVQVSWHKTFKSVSALTLNTIALPIGRVGGTNLSLTTGQFDTAFANSDITAGVFVWCTFPYVPADALKRKPIFVSVTLIGHYL